MKKKQNGFVLLETIVVICTLSVGLLSIYKTYSGLVHKINSNDLNNNAENIFKAEYIAQNFFANDFIMDDGTVYIEIDLSNEQAVKKTCSKEGSNMVNCKSVDFNDETQISAFRVLEINKLYYTKCQINVLVDDDRTYYEEDETESTNQSILLTLDGSTIDYLRSIKNKAESDENKIAYNLIVKSNKGTFGYYQEGS